MTAPCVEYNTINPERLHMYTGKVKRYMEHAKKMALQSDFPDYRHGAVLIKGNSIRNSTYNKDNFCSFGQRFQKDHTGRTTVHAELGVILGLDRSITSGAIVYVARVGKIDEEYRMSKPCQMCNAAMKYVGIKRVVYTINDKEVGSYRL